MELRDVVQSIRRWWWLAALVPLVAGGLLLIRMEQRPYQSTVRATVLIPGDTEVPGSAERPELMVLDDLGPFIGSQAFAEAVSTASNGAVTAERAQATLSGSRYSRVLTIAATSGSADEALAVAQAAEAAIPDAINGYLVPEGGELATVRIIDSASTPSRSRPNQWPLFAAQLLLACAAGCLLAVVADSMLTRPEISR